MVSSIVSEDIGQFQFFLRKHFERKKIRHKQNPTNKAKISEQKTTKATIFRAQKLLRC